MSDAEKRQSEKRLGEELLNAYLDGVLRDRLRAEFEADLESDAGLRKTVELQQQIDSSLQRQFSFEEPPAEHLEMLRTAMAKNLAAREAVPFRLGKHWVFRAAAAILFAVTLGLFWWNSGQRSPEPSFVRRPVAELYQEEVAKGFQPYYECQEVDRFAGTFERRQGKPLWLLPPPLGVTMLGLSYPGGLSPDTTGMLCQVDGQPAMVFVDKLSNDDKLNGMFLANGPNIFRRERFGLVFYEVTPLNAPRCIELFSDQYADGASR